jgi:hypothetical protein
MPWGRMVKSLNSLPEDNGADLCERPEEAYGEALEFFVGKVKKWAIRDLALHRAVHGVFALSVAISAIRDLTLDRAVVGGFARFVALALHMTHLRLGVEAIWESSCCDRRLIACSLRDATTSGLAVRLIKAGVYSA